MVLLRFRYFLANEVDLQCKIIGLRQSAKETSVPTPGDGWEVSVVQ